MYIGGRDVLRKIMSETGMANNRWDRLTVEDALVASGILAFAAAAQIRGRPLITGALIGLLIIKPQYAIGVFLVWLLEPRTNLRQLVGAAGSAISLAIASWLIWPDAWTAFVSNASSVFASIGSIGIFVHRFTLSDSAFLLFGTTAARVVWGVAFVSVVLGWRQVAHRLDGPTKYAASIVIGLIVSPYVMDYDWTLLVVPAAVLWIRSPEIRPYLLAANGFLMLTAMASGILATSIYLATHGERTLQIAPWALIAVGFWFLSVLRGGIDDGARQVVSIEPRRKT